MTKSVTRRTVVCLDNEGYAASLERWKIYLALSDRAAAERGLLRIIDESGEDYLYPKAMFEAIALPQHLRRALKSAA